MDNIDLTQLLDAIDSSDSINIDTSFEYAKVCSIALASGETSAYADAERIVIHMLNKWCSIPEETKPIWGDIRSEEHTSELQSR